MIHEDLDTFWGAWASGRLVLQECAACGSLRAYPTPLCHRCASRDVTWRDAAGTGSVYSYTEVQRRSEPARTVALVELDERVRVLGVIDDSAGGELAIGQPVAIAPDGSSAGPLRFRPH